MSHLSAIDPAIGAEIGSYRIEALLGRGGMGVVYRARDLRLERPVALKVLAPELATDELFRKRFLRESRLAASLDHPNVVPVYEAGEANRSLFIAMRLVAGTDLRDVLERDGPLDPQRTLLILDQVAAALDTAHRCGLCHRDVKPENVLLGDGEHVYLTDFGLSTLSSKTSSLTPTGQLLGTVDYVAPEKIEGREADPAAADEYALGCILVECLTGDPPYPRDTPLASLWAHVQEEPPSLTARRPELPAGLDAVAAQALAKEPAARFGSCAELIHAAQGVFSGQALELLRPAIETRKVVTVLAASVSVVSTTGARLDPEAVRRVASRCLEAMKAAVERHGGLADRVAGDGLLAVFGFPAAREDDAMRAISAALELRDGVASTTGSIPADVDARVAVRVGVEAGEVVGGSSASEVAGEPVQVAVALERAAQAGEVLVGRDVHALLRGAAVVQTLDGDGLRLVELGREPAPRAPASPMVGRERELAMLRELYEDAIEQRCCRLAVALGPPGIGKTRLALELASSLEGSATVLRGRCLSYGDGITYWPVREIVRAAAGDDTWAGLERVLEGEEDQKLIAERVAGAIGFAEATWGGEETFWAIRRLLETLARRRPLLLVVEDVHWAEPTLIELLEHLAAWTRDAPILVLALARTELVEELPASLQTAAALTVQLEPLADSQASLVIEASPAATSVPKEVIANIVQTAEGNPLFLEQLLAMADEDPRHGRRMSLPPAIHVLFAARLDRLSPDERRVLECGAVEGVVFHVGPLAELCPEVGAVAIGRHLLALSRKQLVQPGQATLPGDEALRFRHGLIREAAYESLTQERRAVLHERFATALERVATERSLEESEFIGYHLEQAVRYRTELGAESAAVAELSARSALFLATAGRSALGRGDFRAAATLLARAAALLPPEGRERALVEIDLSTALLEAGRLSEAKAIAAAVEERATSEGQIRARAAVERLMVDYAVDLATAMAEFEHRADELESTLAAAEDSQGLHRLWLLQGLGPWTTGRAARAEEIWEKAAAHASRTDDRAAEANLLGWLASAAFWGPTPVSDGIRRCEATLERLNDRPIDAALVVHFLAGLHAMAGRFDVADGRFRDANASREELGISVHWPVSQVEALAAAMKGDLTGSEELLRLGCERLEDMGERSFYAVFAAELARVAYEQGRLDEAIHWAERTCETAAPDDAIAQAGWRGVSARVLARRGSVEEAARLAREAVGIACATDYLTVAGEAQLDLAFVLDQAGRVIDARAAAQEALALFERKENEIAARQARGLLGRLVRS